MKPIIAIFNGRKINKILCLFFLVMTLIFFGACVIIALFNAEMGEVFLVLSAISGGLSIIYGLLWLVWRKKEQSAEMTMKEAFKQQKAAQDGSRFVVKEFALPKKRLIETALQRFRSIIRWTVIVALGGILLIGGILLATGSLVHPIQLIYLILFFLLIMFPGLMVQWCLYYLYDRSIPSKILLYPGKLVIDHTVFQAREILEIRVSPNQLYNRNSPAVFREMQIRTKRDSLRYRIDYRAGSETNEQPFWTEYGQFVDVLYDWGTENSVPVNILFMD
ncbi:MAG: hypothetical protein IJ206_04435 [Oscillospiraceae bacterium]|nr:hypothetical protein [Oscillospiraceae bacterium]